MELYRNKLFKIIQGKFKQSINKPISVRFYIKSLFEMHTKHVKTKYYDTDIRRLQLVDKL